MSDQLLRLDRQLCFALYAASRAMTRAYGPVLEPLGLTYPQYLVMLVLWETDDHTVGELGDRLGLDSGTLTPLLKRLEQRELIGRSRDPADERVVRIRLTDAGRALRDQATHVPLEVGCRAGFDVTDDDDLARAERLRVELLALSATLDQP
jgi:DNA-binding MarR family transcriptional regulator